jgi:hypothetical protein
MFRKAALLVACATTFALIVPVASAGAAATSHNGVCESGEICAWSGLDYTGCIFDARPPFKDGDFGNGSPVWSLGKSCGGIHIDNKISSFKNRTSTTGTGYWAIWFDVKNYNPYGATFCLAPGRQDPNLGNNYSDIFHLHSANNIFSAADASIVWNLANALGAVLNNGCTWLYVKTG